MESDLHRELCHRAGLWLIRRGCNVALVSPYLSRSSEQPDAIGWKNGAHSIVIEVKVSRSDFLRDKRKAHVLGQRRYYLAPPDIITEKDLKKSGYGLLVWDGKGITKKIESKGFSYSYSIEIAALTTTLQRYALELTKPGDVMVAPVKTIKKGLVSPKSERQPGADVGVECGPGDPLCPGHGRRMVRSRIDGRPTARTCAVDP